MLPSFLEGRKMEILSNSGFQGSSPISQGKARHTAAVILTPLHSSVILAGLMVGDGSVGQSLVVCNKCDKQALPWGSVPSFFSSLQNIWYTTLTV